jgi:CHAD domain-containing protein
MSYGIERNESVADGVRRIATEQIDKAMAEIDDAELDRHETVHQVRKRCKKLRALARLVRPVFPDYKGVNATYRDAAKELSWIRDAHAIIETVDDLVEHFEDAADPEAFRSIRDELVARRDKTDADRETIERRIAQFRDTMAGSRADLNRWRLDADGGRAVAGGAQKTYSRARKAMARAVDTPTTEAFHEWRKRVKYHWYHALLIKRCWPKLIKPWAKEAHRLSDLLGDEHDLAVLHATLLETPERFADRDTLQAFTGLIERRRAELRGAAFRLGTFLLFEKPKRFGQRVELYFDAWREPRQALSAPPSPNTSSPSVPGAGSSAT